MISVTVQGYLFNRKTVLFTLFDQVVLCLHVLYCCVLWDSLMLVTRHSATVRLELRNYTQVTEMLSSIVFVSVWNCGLIEGSVKLIKIATTFIICPMAIAYSMRQIINLVCICQSVCMHSCGYISWSIFTKLGTHLGSILLQPFPYFALKAPILGQELLKIHAYMK